MQYCRFGSGKKNFVMLPGLSIKSVMLSEEAVASAYDLFSEDYTVYLFDRRLNMPQDYSVRMMADNTAEIMKSLNINDAYIFGASQGGMIAQYIAAFYPELVKCMVLGSTAYEITSDSKIREWIRLSENDGVEPLLKSMIKMMYSDNTVSLYGDAIISSMLPVSDEEIKRFRICAKAAAGFSISDDINKIKCPVLAIASEGDKIIDPSQSEYIADKTAGELYVYDKSFGHAVYDEAPDYKEKIIEFFNKC